MNTLISKIVWVTPESEEVLKSAPLVDKYFEKNNLKFRNIVDGLQTMLIEEKISIKDAKEVRNSISAKSILDHSLFMDLEGFIESGDLSRQEMVEAITLAIYYFKNEEHTKILRHLYATILK